MNRWYEDRDFPEIKTSNADIVAVVLKDKERRRLIENHNALIDRIQKLEKALSEARAALEFYAEAKRSKEIENGLAEFGCGCCAGTITEGLNDYDSLIQGFTARNTLAKIDEALK